MKTQRKTYLIVPPQISLMLACFLASEVGVTAQVPGIIKQKPESGRFVEYKDQFLIPYDFVIPGTRTKIKMVPIPAGRFNLEIDDREGRARTIQVQVEPFWMAKTETTWEQYQPFIDLGISFREFENNKVREVKDANKADAVAAPSMIYDEKWRREEHGGDKNHPVGTISQFGAKQYTKYLTRLTGISYRLPSAVEWQYAALATRHPRPSKKVPLAELKKRAWFEANSDDERNHVGQKMANAWGLHDMQGNVAEWVLDQDKYLFENLSSMSLSSLDAVAWPTERQRRIALGGSFRDSADNIQVWSRRVSSEELWELEASLPISPHWTASDEGHEIGFRIIRPVEPVRDLERAKKYWEPDCQKLREDLFSAIHDTGRTSIGIVNPRLPEAIKKFSPTK